MYVKEIVAQDQSFAHDRSNLCFLRLPTLARWPLAPPPSLCLIHRVPLCSPKTFQSSSTTPAAATFSFGLEAVTLRQCQTYQATRDLRIRRLQRCTAIR